MERNCADADDLWGVGGATVLGLVHMRRNKAGTEDVKTVPNCADSLTDSQTVKWETIRNTVKSK